MIDIPVSLAGQDASARVWDVRAKGQIHVLARYIVTATDVRYYSRERPADDYRLHGYHCGMVMDGISLWAGR